MVHPRIWLNHLLPPLKPLELAFLECLSRHLSQPAARLLQQQVDAVNFVQRHSGGKEVNLYCIRRGRPGFAETALFRYREEGMLALAHFEMGSEPLDVEFFVAGGHVFSLVLSRNPSRLRPADVQLKSLSVLLDPLVEGPKVPDTDPSRLTGWVRDWVLSLRPNRLVSPLGPSERERILVLLETAVPDDYLELVAQIDGLESEQIVVHGLRSPHEVVAGPASYLVLASMYDRGALAVEKRTTDKRIVFLDGESQVRGSHATSFRAALRLLLQIEAR